MDSVEPTPVPSTTDNSPAPSGPAPPTSAPQLEPGGPKDNWEVAYVYAFLLKFTDLRSIAVNSLLENVTSLEDALINSSPKPATVRKPTPAPSSAPVDAPIPSNTSSLSTITSEDPAAPTALDPDQAAAPLASAPAPEPSAVAEPIVPEASELLVEIIKLFQTNLPEPYDSHKRRDWFGVLFRFVQHRLLEVEKGGLKWNSNPMKRPGVRSQEEHEREWWLLPWEDKIHLLRILVDWQLTYSVAVRSLIAEAYDLGHQRVAKRDSVRNSLVIDPVGSVGKLTVWHLDDSPRLYASGNPYKTTSPWTTLSTSLEEFKAFAGSLKKSEVAEEEGGKEKEDGAKGAKLAGPFKKAKMDAEKAKKAKEGKGKGKASKKEMEAEAKESATRHKLETVELDVVMAGVAAIEARDAKIAKAAERAATRDARLARQLQKLDYPAFPRERRTRTAAKRVDYVYDDERSEEDEKPRKRGKLDESEDAKEWEMTDAQDLDAVQDTGSRRSSRGGPAERVVPEWRGERRSGRIQQREWVENEQSMELDEPLKLEAEAEAVVAVEEPSVPVTTNGEEPKVAPTEVKEEEFKAEPQAALLDKGPAAQIRTEEEVSSSVPASVTEGQSTSTSARSSSTTPELK
ncbi:hypothetical protein MNV49_004606 [Pseudohyphozyma bogoriensis]|nr:hypothetical protein MNV49_004606 [Pseudohyphozyma bogoriensis]